MPRCAHQTRQPDTVEPLAIIGFACKFPGDADTPEGFWKVLKEKKCLTAPWPDNRVRLDAYYYCDSKAEQQVFPPGAHFVEEDLGAFDSSFFGISGTEANALDPQIRKLLEATYHAFENAGIPIERVRGSRTGVYTGSMSDDYRHFVTKDVDQIPRHAANGIASSMIANRISWFYDFLGPSANLDTACSSSLMAFDVACQGLRNRDSDMAVVAGASMSLAIEPNLLLTSGGFLSPSGKCHSFDHRATGYARGEGFSVVLVQRLSDAIEERRTIRAVVRSTGSNQDGRTLGISQPNGKSQAALIRETYAKAGLTMDSTRFFEAHGTGTSLGDPIEAEAIGKTFRTVRSADDPLYIGACKSNIGHLEGGSGLAGIIKTILILENALIPPNANFERVNPAIDAEFLHVTFPTECVPWPCEGLRRASVSSFGFGGSNSHVILDDSFHHLMLHSLPGIHRTKEFPWRRQDHTGLIDEISEVTTPPWRHRLIPISAADEEGVQRMARSYQEYFQKLHREGARTDILLDQVAYTLATSRTSMAWRSFLVTDRYETFLDLSDALSKPVRVGNASNTAFVFTGQGAQYWGMAEGLVSHPTFRATLSDCDAAFASFGCTFSILGLLLNSGRRSDVDIDDPTYSQPMTTALQLALFELLKHCGVQCKVVVGHSSGEISAAYAAGALDLNSACKVSYFRGRLAGIIWREQPPGAMMSVNISKDQAQIRISQNQSYHGKLHVACVNSPKNVTISGDEVEVDLLKVELESAHVYARKINTRLAYHSPHMQAVAASYLDAIATLSTAENLKSRPTMISSVTGSAIRRTSDLCRPEYWIRNLVSPVEFSLAMETLLSSTSKHGTRKLGSVKLEAIKEIVEIGPHPALQRVVLDNIENSDLKEVVSYHSALRRKRPAMESLLELAGHLFVKGHAVDIAALNCVTAPTSGYWKGLELPQYPFNHSRSYWYESALSRNGRRRAFPKNELCGVPVVDWNPKEPRWRKFFDIAETPWIADHKINGKIIYPATGMIIMAIEAAAQLAVEVGRQVTGYRLTDVVISAPISISPIERTEAQLYMRHSQEKSEKTLNSYDFRIYTSSGKDWMLSCQGLLQTQYKSHREDLVSVNRDHETQYYRSEYDKFQEKCIHKVSTSHLYSHLARNGLEFGPSFQALDQIAWDLVDSAMGKLKSFEWTPQQSNNPWQHHIAHPATLDAMGHLMWVILTRGAQDIIFSGAAVTRVECVWISAQGSSSPATSDFHACCTARSKGLRASDASMFILNSEYMPVAVISNMETTTVGGSLASNSNLSSPEICFEMRWAPDLEGLDGKALKEYTSQTATHELPPTRFYQDLEKIQYHFGVEALKQLGNWNLQEMKPHLKKYLTWLQVNIQQRNGRHPPNSLESNALSKSESMAEMISRIQSTNAQGKLFVEVGQCLPEILSGIRDPLELIFNNYLAEKHYAEICEKAPCRSQIQAYLSLLAHKDPGVKILEVGAGTGSLTGYVLDVFSEGADSGASEALAQYDYTDISKAFFEHASERFAKFLPKINFRALDIERDPVTQGFEPESYDVIVAAWVLHATRNLDTTVRNTRKLLKPGGKLILLELTEPEILRNGFVFGLLPGWWLGEEDFRHSSPCISERRWDTVLKNNGFSGVDIFLPDYEDAACHEHGIMIATATLNAPPATNSESGGRPILLVIDYASPAQLTAHKTLVANFSKRWAIDCTTVAIEEIQKAQVASSTVTIFLAELDRPWIRNLNSSSFTALQGMIARSRTIIWVTGFAKSNTLQSADVSMVLGMARAIRTEYLNLTFVALALEDHSTDPTEWAQKICQVYTATADRSREVELEYVERGGTLYINRVVKSSGLNSELQRRSHATQGKTSWSDGRPLQLTVSQPGQLDSLRFEEDLSLAAELQPDEIEIRVLAAGLNFRDILIALGRLDASTIGCECAGVVTRVGTTGSEFYSPGQRVCAFAPGFRTFARCHFMRVHAIPTPMSFVEAASIPVTGATAYYGLVEIARLQPGETVLIHSAAGGTGQMAVQIALAVGAEVFATVGTYEKKTYIQEIFGIPEDHIFGSRDTSFAGEILRATKGAGVDVVFNSLSGPAMLASWEVIAPYGRFIEVGKADITGNTKLPMLHFAKNVTFSAVALDHMVEHRPRVAGNALSSIMGMIVSGKVKVARPLKEYCITDVEAAFRTMQTGKSTGKIVLTMKEGDLVPAYLKHKSKYSLDGSATYLIAGGLGGLGRSAARWMASRGARNLILLSRSGPKSGAAQKLLSELTSQGVCVATPKADASDRNSLLTILDQCSGMPPVKGCLQATMVLQDNLFETMTWEQWSSSIASKVDSTWNLHEALPGDLSFFIMLSSIAGVAGAIGQSNYAAGNTYQDAFAQYRRSLGRHAVSIDLGYMWGVGVIADNPELARLRKPETEVIQLYESDFIALLDYYCDPQRLLPRPEDAQPILGMGTLAQFEEKGVAPPEKANRHVFKWLRLAANEKESRTSSVSNRDSQGVQDQDVAAAFLRAASSEDEIGIVADALKSKLSRALSMPADEIDRSRPLHVYGVDSLLAVELRSWFTRVFDTDVAIFDITGQVTLRELAEGATKKSELKKGKK